jgi:H+-transporting ATPase
MSAVADTTGLQGLSTQEAQLRLQQYGPNAVVEEKQHPIRIFLSKFWAPVPWMLEITVLLELYLSNSCLTPS